MKHNLKSLLYGFLAIGVFSAIGCSKSSELGLSLVEQEQSDIISFVDSSLIFTTIVAEPTETQGRSHMVCGSYSTPEWGTSESSIYMNFRVPTTGVSFPNTRFDSLVLTLSYETYGHYGDLRKNKPTLAIQSWDVLRVAEDILENEPYTSNRTFITSDVLKGGFQFTPNDTLSWSFGGVDYTPHVRVRLDDAAGLALGESFLHPQGADSIMYESNADFKSWFKGLHIRPTSGFVGNNSIVRMQSKAPMTKLTLYYTDTVGGGNTPQTFEFLTNEDAEVVSTFSHIQPFDLTDNTVTDTISYVQGLDGLHTKIEFPNVGSLGNVIINKAELIIMVADTGTEEHPEIIQLTAKIKDNSGALVFVDDIITSLLRLQSYLLFGGVFEEVNNTKTYLYRLRISEQMQAIVNGETSEKAIYLTTPSALDAERVKLFNHRGIHKAKLHLIYTKIEG
jgi:hypothetical protein